LENNASLSNGNAITSHGAVSLGYSQRESREAIRMNSNNYLIRNKFFEMQDLISFGFKHSLLLFSKIQLLFVQF